MQAVREIRRADSETVTVRILEEFRHKEIEIIVLSFSDITSKDQKDDKLSKFDRLVENVKKKKYQDRQKHRYRCHYE